MKNRSVFKVVCGLAVSLFGAILATSTHAGEIGPATYTLTFTENSATSLSISYTGPAGSFSNPVLNGGPDSWMVGITSQTIHFNLSDFTVNWFEPDNSGEVNSVNFSTDFASALFVGSDQTLLGSAGGTNLNVSIFPDNTPVLVGTDGGNLLAFVFHDIAGPAEAGIVAPESGSTLALLAVSIAGLTAVGRLRRLRTT